MVFLTFTETSQSSLADLTRLVKQICLFNQFANGDLLLPLLGGGTQRDIVPTTTEKIRERVFSLLQSFNSVVKTVDFSHLCHFSVERHFFSKPWKGL